MKPNKKTPDFVPHREEVREGKFPSVKELLNGTTFTRGVMKNLGFILWLAMLGVLYIWNGYHAQNIARETANLKNEVNELRIESVTRAARLMYIGRQSVVTDMIRQRGMLLEEAVVPPFIIK